MMSKIESGVRRGGGGASAVSFLLLALLALPLLVAAYTLYDNRRVVVREEVVEISGLPPAFDGFTILQVSDLHGKRFGPGQERLLRTMAGLDYDGIALTGDMVENDEIDSEPFWELLAGLEGEAPIFYTSGNTGPFDIDLFTGERTPAGDALEEAGVTLLDRPTSIVRGEARLWIADMYLTHRSDAMIRNARTMLETERDAAEKERLEGQVAYHEELKAAFSAIEEEDVLIGVVHYPLSPRGLERRSGGGRPPYDLILAGHYHGGQIRLPFYGALYVPGATLPRRGWFPPQELVSGLIKRNSTYQYVSRGLGASASVSLLNFRLFNPPEVNLIRLVAAR